MDNHLDDTEEFEISSLIDQVYFNHRYIPLQLMIGANTHVGHVRKENQDHYAVIRRNRSQEVVLSDLSLEKFPATDDSAIHN